MSSAAFSEAFVDAVDATCAQIDLLAFAKRVYPKFETPPHIKYIANLLQNVERGELRRLCVSVPVRSGKSVLCSQVFPAFYLGRHPDEPVVLASHAESLAVMHSRVARNIVENASEWPFPNVQMSSDSSSVQRWNLTQGGGMYAIGVGGSVTGRGYRLGLVDDPIHDALSQSERDAAWAWFTEVFVPRADPGAAIIVVAARFASDDLVGRIAESEHASEWEFVTLPAIAGPNDALGREEGQAIWPARMSLAELNERKALMGAKAFSAQFQQDPLPEGGLMFKTEWLSYTYTTLPTARIDDPSLGETLVHSRVFNPFPERRPILQPVVVQWLDSASKTGVHNDRSAIATVISDGVSFFVADVWADRVEYTDLKRIVVAQYDKWRPSRIFVEDASSGSDIISELRRSTSLPIVDKKPGSSKKEARIEATTGIFEAGKVLFPDRASWREDVLNEFRRFPNSRFDDACESVCMAVREAQLIIQQTSPAVYAKLRTFAGWMGR